MENRWIRFRESVTSIFLRGGVRGNRKSGPVHFFQFPVCSVLRRGKNHDWKRWTSNLKKKDGLEFFPAFQKKKRKELRTAICVNNIFFFKKKKPIRFVLDKWELEMKKKKGSSGWFPARSSPGSIPLRWLTGQVVPAVTPRGGRSLN